VHLRTRVKVAQVVLALSAVATWSAHAAAQEAVEALPPAQHTTLVGFDAGGRPAWLESNFRSAGETSDWYTVCVAPCTRRVPASATFRAAGYDFDPSDPFVLLPAKNRVIVTATLTRKSRAVPIAMIALGFTSMLVGGTLVLGGSAMQNQADSETSDQGSGGAIMLGGVGLALTGAAVGTVGIVMLVARVREKKSWVTVTQRSARLRLPGGFGLEPSGITF
jgi:hypothetical protein